MCVDCSQGQWKTTQEGSYDAFHLDPAGILSVNSKLYVGCLNVMPTTPSKLCACVSLPMRLAESILECQMFRPWSGIQQVLDSLVVQGSCVLPRVQQWQLKIFPVASAVPSTKHKGPVHTCY
jgi:hypothetical protein